MDSLVGGRGYCVPLGGRKGGFEGFEGFEGFVGRLFCCGLFPHLLILNGFGYFASQHVVLLVCLASLVEKVGSKGDGGEKCYADEQQVELHQLGIVLGL